MTAREGEWRCVNCNEPVRRQHKTGRPPRYCSPTCKRAVATNAERWRKRRNSALARAIREDADTWRPVEGNFCDNWMLVVSELAYRASLDLQSCEPAPIVMAAVPKGANGYKKVQPWDWYTDAGVFVGRTTVDADVERLVQDAEHHEWWEQHRGWDSDLNE